MIESKGKTNHNAVLKGPEGHSLCVFKDENPKATDAERYKAVAYGGWEILHGLTSPDGIHWSLMSENPLKVPGTFDSLNVVFWDSVVKKYRLFSRHFEGDANVRAIQMCESDDFIN
jgi:hypothetical protein